MAGASDNPGSSGTENSSSVVTPSLEALLRAASIDAERSNVTPLRPVESWNPPYCGDIGLRIARDGTWFYRGSAIQRQGLVRLFASILRKDPDGKTYLITPAEKVDVDVEDAPFLGVELMVSGMSDIQVINVRTNVDDTVTIDAAHPLRFNVQDPSGGLKPYVLIRGRLEALCTRAVYAELVALAVRDPNAPDAADAQLGVWSAGHWWALAARDAASSG